MLEGIEITGLTTTAAVDGFGRLWAGQNDHQQLPECERQGGVHASADRALAAVVGIGRSLVVWLGVAALGCDSHRAVCLPFNLNNTRTYVLVLASIWDNPAKNTPLGGGANRLGA